MTRTIVLLCAAALTALSCSARAFAAAGDWAPKDAGPRGGLDALSVLAVALFVTLRIFLARALRAG